CGSGVLPSGRLAQPASAATARTTTIGKRRGVHMHGTLPARRRGRLCPKSQSPPRRRGRGASKVGTDRVLTPELVAGKSSIAQVIREGALGIGGCSSQRAGPHPGFLVREHHPGGLTLLLVSASTHLDSLPQAGEGDLGRRSCLVLRRAGFCAFAVGVDSGRRRLRMQRGCCLCAA